MFSLRVSAAVMLSAAAILVNSMTISWAQAQEGGLLEEIVVTARMRAENLQEVPVTVSAFTADDIDSIGVAVNDSEITAESFRGYVGNDAPQTPDHTLNIGLQYQDPEGRFFVRGDFQQIGELFFMPANWVARDELDLINLRGGYNFGSDQSLQLAIWCDNCTDENYFGEGFNDAGGLFYYGKLRQAGVELTKRF